MNSGLNVLDTTPTTASAVTAALYDWRVWGLIALIVVILVAVGAFLNYERWAASPWWSDRYYASQQLFSWLPSMTNQAPQSESKSIVPEQERQDEKEERHKPEPRDARETWCLVGEDLNGRYCIRVPGPHSCTHERSFLSRDQCELTPAMHLPAGAVENGGLQLDPLKNHKFD
jgi:hypothetical protein